MKPYHDLLTHIMETGVDRPDRTGTGTRSVFGYQMRFDLAQGFPLLTTKRVHLRSVIFELLWFLRGDTNVRWLQENGVTIWDEWADEEGNIGPVYGKQWRSWWTGRHVPFVDRDGHIWHRQERIDQISSVIIALRTNPDSRRHIVTAWNPAELDDAKLPPCHILFQFYVANGKLSCQLYQRSADAFLGVPFNIASYALLTMMVAQVTGLKPGEFIHTLGDAHIYHNHFDQVRTQLGRVPKPLPIMILNPDVTDIFSFKISDFTLAGYDPDPAIPAPVAV